VTEYEIGEFESRVRSLVPKLLALVLAVAVPFVAYGLVGDATHSHIFLVQDVRVGPLETLDEADILRIADMDRARNVLMVDAHAMETRLEAEPWIRAAAVTIDLRAQTVQIDIEERTLAAIVADGPPLMVDPFGVPIRRWEGETLDAPVVVGVPVSRDESGTLLPDAERLEETLRVIAIADTEFPTRRLREIHHRGSLGFRLHFDRFEVTVAPDRVSARMAHVHTGLAGLDRRPSYALADASSPTRITFGFLPVPSEER
jgi:hypothetical protein